MEKLLNWVKRFLILGGLVVLITLLFDFNYRMVHMLQLREERNFTQAKLEEALILETKLENDIAYAESGDSLNKWARIDNAMQNSGDYVFVIIPVGTPISSEKYISDLVKVETTPWNSWKEWLLFREQE